jgi:cysteinyl-tRNA synthetase
MSMKYLGDTLDIHCGGQDLIVPHHENEVAQSNCANDCEFVKYWLHNGFVTINKEKMSKSLGNFLTVDELLKTYDSNTIRFFILTNHYRMPVEFSEVALEGAKAGVKRLINAGVKGEGVDKEAVAAFKAAMDEDMNTSKALAVLFSLVSGDEAKANTLYTLGSVLGFDFTKKEVVLSDEDFALIEERNRARAEKNWAKSDEIRDLFLSRGIALKDSKDSTTWEAV